MRCTFFALLLVASLVAVAGAAPVVAQEGNTTGVNQTTAASNVDDTLALSDAVKIMDWSIRDGTATVTVRTEISRTVVMSDAAAGVGEEGATRVPEKTWNLPRGTHTLTMSIEEFRGVSAVTVSTAGGSYRLSTEGSQQALIDLPGAPRTADMPFVWSVVIATAAVLLAGCAWSAKSGRLGGVIRVF